VINLNPEAHYFVRRLVIVIVVAVTQIKNTKMKTTLASRLWVLLAAVAIQFALFFGSDLARADAIVDTGSTGPLTGNSGALYGSQWLAAEFTLPASATISDIRGWIYSGFGGQYYGSGGDLTIAIYTNTNSATNNVFNTISAPGSVLYSTSVNVPNNAPLGWIGPSGLNWDLSPGKYWVAFEVQAGSSFFGYMPGSPLSSLPTDFIFGQYIPGPSWVGPVITSQNLGVQILGTVGKVLPIPLSIQSVSNAVVLRWNDPASVFILQAAPTVSGVFSNIPSATSPYTNSATGAQQFYRLIYPAN
jgi:hypothetical protein